jgi:2-dehydro-3-deoxy-D-arabinonate dehydratase
MKLYKTESAVLIFHDGKYFGISRDWDGLINRDDLHSFLMKEIGQAEEFTGAEKFFGNESLPPVGSQEVWAAGVTYSRSKEARMDESKDSGGATFYDKVYEAERPELFFKATPQRVVGNGAEVFIRRDSTWNVPEPELTLFINSQGNIQGYTIGNDMSSRSIEGENPLYLPQAKTYDRSAALGPCLYVPSSPISPETTISMEITRAGKGMYQDRVQISRMKRTHRELASYLFRECTFPHGVFLMTGTCLVPPNDFTLTPGDVVTISIEGIGTLTNTVGIRP